MKLPIYLSEIRHAVNIVVSEIYREQDVLNKTRNELDSLRKATNSEYRRAESLSSDPDLDDEGLGTGAHWDTYFGVDKDRYEKNAEHEVIAQRVAARQFSVAALSGSLLQYGKQGISLHYGKNREGCPDGRTICGLPISEIIWQSRNQALHWEDGTFDARTTKCFERLAESNQVFARYSDRSLAFEVVKLLGWKDADAFFHDMQSLST